MCQVDMLRGVILTLEDTLETLKSFETTPDIENLRQLTLKKIEVLEHILKFAKGG